ncbi:MAG: ribbon-helix-helix protein, CopG family [Leucobacter sp.]
MKTAISIPDEDFERFERLAARQGMNRSEFYRTAAIRFADLLEEGSMLTAVADAVLEQTGQPADPLFLRESERVQREEVEW